MRKGPSSSLNLSELELKVQRLTWCVFAQGFIIFVIFVYTVWVLAVNGQSIDSLQRTTSSVNSHTGESTIQLNVDYLNIAAEKESIQSGIRFKNRSLEHDYAQFLVGRDNDGTLVSLMLQPPHYVDSDQVCMRRNGWSVRRSHVDTDSGGGCPAYHMGINTDRPMCHLDVNSTACVRGELAVDGKVQLFGCPHVDLCATLTQFASDINQLKQQLPP